MKNTTNRTSAETDYRPSRIPVGESARSRPTIGCNVPHHRDKDGRWHTYWSLVETIRTPDGPRQRTQCHLGELNDSAQGRWLKTIEVFNEAGEWLH